MDSINTLKTVIAYWRSPRHLAGPPPRPALDIGMSRPDRRIRRRRRWPALILLAVLAAGCAAQGPAGPTPSEAPQPRPAQQPSRPAVGTVPPSARNAVGKAVIHTVKPGEILSKIAMRYYSSYLTEVFYLPARNAFVTSRIAGQSPGKRIRIGIVTDLIEQVNGFAADNLHAGQQIRLPRIEGLPFLQDRGQETAVPAPAPESPLTPPQPPPEPRPTIPTPPPAPPKPTPDTVHLTLLKGIDAFNAQDYAAATDSFQRVLKKRPRHSVARHYLARSFYQKGLAARKAGKPLPAIEAFRAALDHDPDCHECEQTLTELETRFKEIHYKNGIRYFEKEELDKAIVEWEMVYRLDPDYENVRKNIELARRLLKRLGEMEQ